MKEMCLLRQRREYPSYLKDLFLDQTIPTQIGFDNILIYIAYLQRDKNNKTTKYYVSIKSNDMLSKTFKYEN